MGKSPASRGAICACVLASGCATHDKAPSEPPVQVPETFSHAGTSPLPDRWWTELDDPRLNELVQEGLTANFNLRVARERLKEARAVTRRAEAEQLPLLRGFAGAERTESTSDSETNESAERIEAGLAASYEVDLWGRLESAAEAEDFRAQATRADLQAAAQSVAGEIALTWTRLRAAIDIQHVLDEQINANQKRVRLLENRFAVGQASRADLLRQRQLLVETRRDATAAKGARRVLSHRLAVLTGRPPRADHRVKGTPPPELPPCRTPDFRASSSAVDRT